MKTSPSPAHDGSWLDADELRRLAEPERSSAPLAASEAGPPSEDAPHSPPRHLGAAAAVVLLVAVLAAALVAF